MLSSLHQLLERLAERCLALTAGLLATSIEALHVRYQAEQQCRLEELARTFEADGKPELAQSLRDRAAVLVHDNPAARGETLLRGLTEFPSDLNTAASNHGSAAESLALPGSARRRPARSKHSAAVAAPLATEPADRPAANTFFPLNGESALADEDAP